MEPRGQAINRSIKKKWLKALRSGKYVQGIGALRRKGFSGADSDEFCCLGVLCDVVNRKAWSKTYHRLRAGHAVAYGRNIFMPSKTTTTALGISVEHINRLSYMNDADRLSFNAIANIIEELL